MNEAIELSGVGLTLGSHRFAFDLAVPAGSFTAVTGPSGSGKSTLFNIIAGFELPDMGRVRLGGEDMGAVPPGKRPASLVFQDNNLFAHLDVFTNVALGVSPSLRLDAAARAWVSEALSASDSAGSKSGCPRRYPAAKGSARPLHGRLCASGRSCCWTSHLRRSILHSGIRWASFWPRFTAMKALPC